MNDRSLADFYKGKRILITGHTGFKGSWLSIWLDKMGAEVIGYALAPYSKKDNFVLSGIGNLITDLRGDIKDLTSLKEVFDKYQPEIVFHLAAQPLVHLSYNIPVETYEVNVMGSIHVMEAARRCQATKVVIMITTDKCYENKEQLWGYRENDPLGGYDPYSSSKGAAEIAISSWRRSFMNPNEYAKHGKSIASARAGNVIGGGDWASNRIIPDCMRAIEDGKRVEIRNPQSIRPWQHVLEPLSGYILLAKKLWNNPTTYCEGWNFGPDVESVSSVWDIASEIISDYGSGELADISNLQSYHEAKLLMLDNTKAKIKLGWYPRITLKESIALTADWYKRYGKENVYSLCLEQINKFF